MCPLYEVVFHVKRGVVGLDLNAVFEVFQDGSVNICTDKTLAETVAAVLTGLVGICVLADNVTAEFWGAGKV